MEKQSIMMKQFKLKLPIPQNFITVDMPDGSRSSPVIDVTALSEEEAIQFAEELKQDFIRNWKKRTSKPTSNGE